jgi:uncharacterized membrane protein (DUF485 family)
MYFLLAGNTYRLIASSIYLYAHVFLIVYFPLAGPEAYKPLWMGTKMAIKCSRLRRTFRSIS